MNPPETTCPACGAADPEYIAIADESEPLHWICRRCEAAWVQPPRWLSRLIGEPESDDDQEER